MRVNLLGSWLNQLLDLSRIFHSLMASLRLIFFDRSGAAFPHLFYLTSYVPINSSSYSRSVCSCIPTDRFTSCCNLINYSATTIFFIFSFFFTSLTFAMVQPITYNDIDSKFFFPFLQVISILF